MTTPSIIITHKNGTGTRERKLLWKRNGKIRRILISGDMIILITVPLVIWTTSKFSYVFFMQISMRNTDARHVVRILPSNRQGLRWRPRRRKRRINPIRLLTLTLCESIASQDPRPISKISNHERQGGKSGDAQKAASFLGLPVRFILSYLYRSVFKNTLSSS